MKAKTWKPERGDALQGDVILFRVPDDLKIDTSDEIKPEDGRLILASGEVTGHHHAIWAKYTQVAHLHDEALARDLMAAQKTDAQTKLFRDPDAVAELVRRGELTTADLAIGFLIIDGEPETLTHDEHAGIVMPKTVRAYVGAQRERDAAAVRRVMD